MVLLTQLLLVSILLQVSSVTKELKHSATSQNYVSATLSIFLEFSCCKFAWTDSIIKDNSVSTSTKATLNRHKAVMLARTLQCGACNRPFKIAFSWLVDSITFWPTSFAWIRPALLWFYPIKLVFSLPPDWLACIAIIKWISRICVELRSMFLYNTMT